MSVIPKRSRIYPYQSGLLLGAEFDIVLSTINSEPLCAKKFVTKVKSVPKTGGGEAGTKANRNHFKERRSMVRLYSKTSYCRAYATDNIWFSLKELVGLLKKKAYLSFLSSYDGVPTAGHIKIGVPGNNDIYGGTISGNINGFVTGKTNKSHVRFKDNVRLTLGILSVLLDRRPAAEKRRKEYGPYVKKEFRISKAGAVYQTPTNYWIFSPILTHLMFGAARMAVFITLNNIEEEIWKDINPKDIKDIILNSDYKAAEKIWKILKNRLGNKSGYRKTDNPFLAERAKIIDFLIEYGIGIIGSGVYKNWRMSRRKKNYGGHFRDLPSWEQGAAGRVFTEKHPNYKLFKQFNKEKNGKKRTKS